ncbi:uncharacterized protein PRCAT00002673001 [Priceomyces carsonii]|uniref:uncharacterized protein n=1 Tax=Priceomyces carsonii TaxID=28549 RepID=UPI002ED9DE5E|nr:unnamed protein product [Priceomyces carsonii]
MSTKKSALSSSTVLYVGQLPYDWDEQIIKSVVCGSGNIVDVRLGYDYAGKNKGFCFVEYQSPQEAQKALRLLDQVKLLNPATPGQIKKLRIELSKEGLRSNATSEHKSIMRLDRNMLPPYVQLPQEMVYNGPPLPNHSFVLPPPNIHQFNTDQLQQQIMNNPIPSSVPQLPSNIANATKVLPQPQNLPFAIPDKINETLSNIPPVKLMEFISNLKGILNGPNSSRAIDVFQVSPQLAPAAAQALLLMGFIDEEVISDSMKNPGTGTPQQQQSQPHLPPIPPTNNPYGQPMMQPQNMGKWLHLPPSTQAKLAVMSPGQADLIAQVLSLPADQISSLPPDKQAMVINLRAQYL